MPGAAKEVSGRNEPRRPEVGGLSVVGVVRLGLVDRDRVAQNRLERPPIRSWKQKRKDLVGQRHDPHRHLPERIAHPSRCRYGPIESRRLIRSPRRQHRTRRVERKEHLSVHALGPLVRVLDHRLRRGNAHEESHGDDRSDGQPRGAARRGEPEQ